MRISRWTLRSRAFGSLGRIRLADQACSTSLRPDPVKLEDAGQRPAPSSPTFAVGLTHVLSQRGRWGLTREVSSPGVPQRNTATKYRNTTTATRHPARLGAA